MSYNLQDLPQYVNTAGKVTLLTAFSGVLVFMCVFLFNVGANHLQEAHAQGSATTTLTVLNTPPEWDLVAFEQTESSTSTPTNSGDTLTWYGVATDSNGAPYFMIVCAENVRPIANAAADSGSLGTEPPECAPGVVQWAVSAATVSGVAATAATTTTEASPFGERQMWYSWVCDDDPVNPRCNSATSTGYSATNTAPFHVNRRPVFADYSNNSVNSPYVPPGGDVVFYSTSSDPDVIGDTNGGADEIFLVVCSAQTYDTNTNDCAPADFLASTSITMLSDASATYTLDTILQDQPYFAYGYIVDEHGHEAIGVYQATNTPYIVANVAPTVSNIQLNGVSTIILDQPAGETSSQYTLTFVTADANSCDAVGGANAYDEIDDYAVGIFRSGVGSSTCNANDLTDPAATHNENNCYVSSYTPWNLSCTASSTTCAGSSDDTMLWECTFPLWFIADPTDSGTPFEAQYWVAAVSGIDDDNATGTYATSSTPVELQSFPALDMDADSGYLVYGALEPGTDTGTLSTTTVIENQGNTGLDENLSGTSMCGYFTLAVTCQTNATSTIGDFNQEFASTTPVTYGSGTDLSSTTVQELELNVQKTTSTSTLSTGTTYWGIAVPGTIELAGDYTGLNTFAAVKAEVADW